MSEADERGEQDVRRRHLPVARQRAGHDQRRHGRHRRAELLEQHVDENQRDAVDEDVVDEMGHACAW